MTSNGSITRCRCPRLRRLGALREPRHLSGRHREAPRCRCRGPARTRQPDREAAGRRRPSGPLRARIEEINALDIAFYAALQSQRGRRPGRIAALFSSPRSPPPGPCACALTDGREPRFQPHRVPGGGADHPAPRRRDPHPRRFHAAAKLCRTPRGRADRRRHGPLRVRARRQRAGRSRTGRKRLDRLEDLARRRPARGRLFDLAQARRRGRRQGRFHSRGCTTRWPSRSRRPRAFGTGPAAISFR